MKMNEVQIGGTYQANVSNKLVTGRIDSAVKHGGWLATNLETGKQVRIKTAQRFRKPMGKTQKANKPATPPSSTSSTRAAAFW